MNISYFLLGVAAATYAAAGLFFLKFWRASRNRFFAYFASACWLLALERFLAVFYLSQDPLRTAATDSTSWVYLFRLLAFVLILIAAFDKNR